jgi:hypothetical protein
VIALVLLALPWLAAVVLARRHYHLNGGTIAILVAVSLGLPTLWLTWAAYRGPRRVGTRASGLSTAQVADQLAVAVGAQWTAEAAIRRLNDPWPLPVSWVAADASLTDSWDSLVTLASSGAGWPSVPPTGTWADGPDDLAGEGGELVEVLARVPTGRLVVLGEPGAGKTMLMVRLVLDLLARRAQGGPIPFLASLASWNPEVQDLRSWLGSQLLIGHPALAGFPAEDRAESTQAEALLVSGLILPVLDGLDEIPDQVRGAAITRINDMLMPSEQVVVTCRSEQYRNAVRPEGGVEVTLRATAAVQLRPLEADIVRRYLCDDAAGPVAKARWAPVLAVLGTQAPAGQALSTPLMVGLARAIYNPRPGELAGTLRDPAELCIPRLADRSAIESVLFDAFIPAAYRHDPGARWKSKKAEAWLVFLARHLDQRIDGPDLAWWQLQKAAPKPAFQLAFGLSAGLGVWLGTGLVTGLLPGLVFGLLFGVAAGLGAGFAALARGMQISFLTGPRDPLPPGLTAGLAGLAAGLLVGLVIGPLPGLIAAFMAGLAFGLAFGVTAVPHDLAEVTSPWAVLARDQRAASLIMLVFGLGVGLVDGLGAGLGLSFVTRLGTGLVSGLVFGFFVSGTQTAWPSYMLIRGWLAFRQRLPWSLMDFLADAHRRGILRQAGAVYQFRHIELQHRLANRGTDKQKPAH